MNILYVTYAIDGLLMILLPIALGIWLNRKFRLGWRLWWIGAATFVLSQVGHIPFNIAIGVSMERGLLPAPPAAWESVFQAIFLGLSAGLWEELARYATYRWWAKDARSWDSGVVLGAGHGGIESILFGLLVLATYVSMVIAANTDLSSIVPADQLSLAKSQIDAYWSVPWYTSLLGALERAFTIIFHIAASLLVLQVFLRRQLRWLWLAVFWHAFVDAAAVYVSGAWGVYAAEAVVAASALVNLGIIIGLRPEETDSLLTHPEELSASQPSVSEQNPIPDMPESPENLEDTRYN